MGSNQEKYNDLHFRTFQSYKKLEEAGFSFLDSYDGTKYFSLRFPVCFWKKNSGQQVPTLFAYLTVNSDTMEVKIDVKTTLGLFYPDFYNQEYGKSTKLMNEVYKRIDKQLKELDIIQRKEVKNGSNKTRNKKNRRSDSRSPINSEQVLQRSKSCRDRPKRRRPFRKSLQENR